MIYNLYKPKNYTSFSVVRQVKKITSEKVGHSGTLDPFADGVLVIGIGKSTKKLSEIIEYDKRYKGVIKIGEKTDTKDLTGSIIKKEDIPEIKDIDLNTLAKSFIGKHMQKPPMYSARKINGVRLYKLARQNISVERNPKEIEMSINNIPGVLENGLFVDLTDKLLVGKIENNTPVVYSLSRAS